MNVANPDPADLIVYLGGMTHADATVSGLRVVTGHIDVQFHFPAAMSPADRAAICAQQRAAWAEREAHYLAADAVPAQRTAVQ